jgi:hypothetical protein
VSAYAKLEYKPERLLDAIANVAKDKLETFSPQVCGNLQDRRRRISPLRARAHTHTNTHTHTYTNTHTRTHMFRVLVFLNICMGVHRCCVLGAGAEQHGVGLQQTGRRQAGTVECAGCGDAAQDPPVQLAEPCKHGKAAERVLSSGWRGMSCRNPLSLAPADSGVTFLGVRAKAMAAS